MRPHHLTAPPGRVRLDQACRLLGTVNTEPDLADDPGRPRLGHGDAGNRRDPDTDRCHPHAEGGRR